MATCMLHRSTSLVSPLCISLPAQIALVNLPSLTRLHLEGTGGFSAAQAEALPTVLGKPGMEVVWTSQCSRASLLYGRGFGSRISQEED